MGKAFWIRRFFFVWGLAFVVIAMGQVLKGRELMFAVTEGARWGLLASMVFVTARVWQSRRKQLSQCSNWECQSLYKFIVEIFAIR